MTRLLEGFSGVQLRPGDSGYDAARRVWNGMVDRRPAVIARCTSTADVVAAIRFAREQGLELGVRGGGHSVVGFAVPQDGLMLDLSPMRAVRVDPLARTARIAGGALLGALDRATQAHGLATTAGNVSHTGVGGLTLGGGEGWLGRRLGLACDNVLSCTVVTADGQVVTASAADHPDLFWGLRGGGGNFGVVTEFEFRLHEVGTRSLVIDLEVPFERAPAALRGWRDLLPEAPREATLLARVTGDPDHPAGPPRVHLGCVWVGDPDAGRAWLPTLRGAVGPGVATEVRELTYLDLQTCDDDTEAHAVRRYWKGHYFDTVPDAMLDAFLARGHSGGAGAGFVPNGRLTAVGGAVADVPDADSAFGHRDAVVEFTTSSGWTDPVLDADRIAGCRRYGAALEPFASGVYVNVISDEGQAGVRRAYRPEKLAKLTALKDRWDPRNVFHLNPNIRPGAQLG
jgi:FAD/FMN-containing dehydrogenase